MLHPMLIKLMTKLKKQQIVRRNGGLQQTIKLEENVIIQILMAPREVKLLFLLEIDLLNKFRLLRKKFKIKGHMFQGSQKWTK